MARKHRLLIVGGGAAGFFCAINAAIFSPELEVVLLEKSSKFLAKVAISGGGRCNVTQACSSISEMIKAYPRGSRFLKKAFHQFFTNDTIKWFEERGVPLKAEDDGRVFPRSDSSSSIVNCLLQEARKAGVSLQLNRAVISIEKKENQFLLRLKGEENFSADYVCIACGGFPKKEQFSWLAALDLKIVPPVPSLFSFNMPGHSIKSLMGVSVAEVEILIKGSRLKSDGPVLITHWGLSGPAVLKLSAMAARELADTKYHFSIKVNWLPEFHEEQLRQFFISYRNEKGASKIGGRNPFGLPSRLWLFLLEETGIDTTANWAELPAKQQNVLATKLTGYEMEVKGKTTYKEEFVTAGGVNLEEIEVQNMEVKKHPGLFFAGEILDIDGVTGGYNFQNAWTTGFVAACGIKNRELRSIIQAQKKITTE